MHRNDLIISLISNEYPWAIINVSNYNVSLMANGKWILGNITTTDEDITEVCPLSNIANMQKSHIIHNSWRVVAFKIYRPLIYFCPFGKKLIFECIDTAIQSLNEFGKWKHNIIVFTAEDTKELLERKLSSLELEQNLHIISITPATDTFMARYRINHPLLQQAQLLLYLDSDVVCIAVIYNLLINLIDNHLIHDCREGIIGEGSSESGGYW